tara:strand:- start:95 stop:304 length:210 start_codon:yes stop_codon:yes gene_type:complete
MASSEENKKNKLSEKIENLQSSIGSLRNDMKEMSQEISIIKNLIGEYLLINTREEVLQKKVKGYLWGHY